MSAQLHPTLHWAPEVERATLAIAWWHPHLVGIIQRELHPDIHFTVLQYRIVLEVLSIVFRQEGHTEFQSVVACIIELGAFEECGGREGLNEILTDRNQHPWGVSQESAEPILRDHIRYLKEAAKIRGVDPTKPFIHYTGGHGFLQKNKAATKPTHPVVIGKARLFGHQFNLAGWSAGEDVKLTFELMR